MSLGYTAQALKLAARDPAEALDRLRSKIEHRADRRRGETPPRYDATPDCDRRLHEALDAPFPCAEAAEFEAEWAKVAELFAGSDSFIGEWAHDADQSLGRAVWCVVRHTRAERVVETGVARGITSRVILKGLERNGGGRLWSVDLPVVRTSWHEQTAAAVPAALRERWTYIRGSSRRRLPSLLSELGEIDVFVHDSAHTESNMRFEFEQAWPALRSGGALISHDVVQNRAFFHFAGSTSGQPILARYADGGLVGIVVNNAAPRH